MLPHRIVCDVEQLFECPTGIDIGFISSIQGLISFGDPRRVGILSFLGVDRVRSLLLDTMGNEVADCLYSFDRVVVMVEVCLELCTRGCDVRVLVRLGGRSEDGVGEKKRPDRGSNHGSP